jgi:cytosine deaminase
MTPAGPADWVLREARLLDVAGPVDIAIRAERIDSIGPALPLCGQRELQLDGRLVLPGFVDAHLHLDKAYALEQRDLAADSLAAAIAAFQEWRDSVSLEQIYRGARRVAERALLHGTVALRTHVTVDRRSGLSLLETLRRLRDEMTPRLIIQLVAFPESAEVDDGSAWPLLRQACDAGADAIGGAPATSANPRRFVDRILEWAGALGRDLDLHVDESDDPAHNALEYLAERKLATGFAGEVVAGHCCALAALEHAAAQRTIEKVAQAGIHVITLPSCNLYLMGRQDRGLIRRGLTRVSELLAAGVNVIFASDNIRDPFNPFGDADMLQETLIAAHALQMGSVPALRRLIYMATYGAARVLKLRDYGLQPGCRASLVVLDASDLGDAIARLAPRRYVFAGGLLVAETVMHATLSAG